MRLCCAASWDPRSAEALVAASGCSTVDQWRGPQDPDPFVHAFGGPSTMAQILLSVLLDALHLYRTEVRVCVNQDYLPTITRRSLNINVDSQGMNKSTSKQENN